MGEYYSEDDRISDDFLRGIRAEAGEKPVEIWHVEIRTHESTRVHAFESRAAADNFAARHQAAGIDVRVRRQS